MGPPDPITSYFFTEKVGVLLEMIRKRSINPL